MKRKILRLVEPVYIRLDKGKEVKVYAKVDTGATRSSISKELVERIGMNHAKKTAVIKSALGREKRKFVKASIKLRGKKLKVYLSVADRGSMRYSVLIGRNVLKLGKFLIDPLK